MKPKFQSITIVLFFVLAGLLSGCGPGQLFGPTVTPTPTITSTPTVTHTATATPTVTPTFTPVPPSPTPTTISNEPGSSFATAIVIEADNDFDVVVQEYEWLQSHYPGYQQQTSQGGLFHGDRAYDVFSIVTADGIELDIYFDISVLYGKF